MESEGGLKSPRRVTTCKKDASGFERIIRCAWNINLLDMSVQLLMKELLLFGVLKTVY